MAEKDLNNILPVNALRVTEDAHPGWSSIRHLREPLFLGAICLCTVFGFIVGMLFYLYDSHIISYEIKDFHVFITFVLVFGAGLYLHGELTARRFGLLALAGAMNQAWLYFFWQKFPVNLLNILIGCWLFLYWIWTEPELMEKFGFRKKSIARDLLVSVSISIVIMAYLIPVLMAYDFKFSIKSSALLTFVANVLSQNMINYGVMFSVWNALDRRGNSQMGGLVAIAIMVFAQQVFTWIEIGINGILPPALVLGGMFAISMLFVLAFGISFRVFRNTLPAVFIVTTTQLCVVMIGFMK